jgi:tetratricopeptide (TPR) repeat protein
MPARLAAAALLALALAGCAALPSSREQESRARGDLWAEHNDAGVRAAERRELDRAIELYTRALDVARQERRDAPRRAVDLAIALSLKNRAYTRSLQPDRAAAEADYREALAIREAVLPRDSPEIGDVLNDLGAVLREDGRAAEARPLLERAVRIYAAARQKPRLAIALANLGHVEAAQGRPLEAEVFFRRALLQTEAAIGPHPRAGHPGLGQLRLHLRDYAAALRANGQAAEAAGIEQRIEALGGDGR